MEGQRERELRYHLLKKFMKKPYSSFDSRTLGKCLVEEEHSIQELFNARYDKNFIENISDKKGKNLFKKSS